MRDAEPLFLVDDDKAEALEVDVLGKQRVGADDHVDRAVGKPFLDALGLRRGDEAGEAADADREAFEAGHEIVVMLAREERRRADDRDLHAGHGGDEGGTQRDLRLAEADVADDQPVHRLAGGEIGQRFLDRAVLIVGFLIRETIDEAGVAAAVGLGDLALAKRAQGRCGDQLTRDLADALLHLRLAALPRLAAEPVEAGAFLAGAVAAEHLEVLDRDVELVAAGIFQLHAIVRRLGDRDLSQPDVAADAVIGVDDEIAGRERGEFGEEGVGGLAALGTAHEPVAEHVLFGEDGYVGCGEAMVER